MDKEKLALEFANFVVENWQSLIFGTTSFLVSLIGGTWMIAKQWFSREIKLCKTEHNASCQIHDKELRHLTRQLSDKNSYAQGVIEIMNQRLLGAQDEPQRLLNIIRQNEDQLAELKRENKQLLSKVKRIEHKSRDTIFWKSIFDEKLIKSELNNFCHYNFKHFAADDDINVLCKDYMSISSQQKDEGIDFKAVTPIIVLLLKVQTQKILTLDIGLSKCNTELNRLHTYYFDSTIKILKPLVSSKINKDQALNRFDQVAYILNKLKHKRKLYYLEWIKDNEIDDDLEEDKEEEVT